MVFELGEDLFRQLLAQACRYCGQPAGGIDRVNSSVGYTVENSAPCCSTCNVAKSNMSALDFRAWVERVHSFWASKPA